MTPLDRALQDLVEFLTATPVDDYWLGELTRVQRATMVADTREAAVTELRSWFAGMGSLNDLWYAPNANVPAGGDADRLNAELSRKLDTLYHAIRMERHPWARLLFGLMARWRSSAIPPRVLGAFSLTPPPSAASRPPGSPNRPAWRVHGPAPGGTKDSE